MFLSKFVYTLGLFITLLLQQGNKLFAQAADSNSTYVPQTHYYNWTTGWGTYNVDGNAEVQVITCNGQFPWPSVRVKQGDRLVVTLNNGFTDRNTTLHFHGLFMEGTNQMDGPDMVTQCPVGPGSTFVYNFTVPSNRGSYWYHSHTAGQYMDGMKGTVVVEDPDFPFDYDKEEVLELAEWYHDSVDVLTKKFMNVYNPTGAEPIPQNLIINNTRNLTWEVEPDTTYLLRIINTGGFVSQYFWIEDHDFQVIEVDGIYVEPYNASMIYITVAQRYTVLLKTKSNKNKNYAIMQKFDDTMLDTIPGDLELNQTSYLMYDTSLDKPTENILDELDFLDDFDLVPYGDDKEEMLGDPDYTVTVDVSMNNLKNGVNYAFFNNITYMYPKVPTLISVLSSGDDAKNAIIYGTNTHAVVLEKDEIVEIVLNNLDTGTHPFHLHGHAFQVIQRAEARDDDQSPLTFNATETSGDWPEYPMRRDTVYVRPQSNFAVRFKADNPGVWFFHCHIEWHMMQGLILTLIEDPETIQNTESQQLTDSHKQVCENLGVSLKGNAAGNFEDFTDLTGQNVQVKDLPAGFTKKGIVAMFFSCLAGILGMISLSVYGLMGLNDDAEVEFMEDFGIDPERVVDDVVHEEEEEDNHLSSSSNEGVARTSFENTAKN